MVVAAAGPGMNFLLAWIGAVALHVVPWLSGAPREQEWALTFLFYFLLANIVLGIFNLLPIPPLDGGRIVVGLLPEAAARVWARTERAGLLIVLLLVFLLPSLLHQFGITFDPVRQALGAVTGPIFRLLLTLAGRPEAGMVLMGDGQQDI
jgi:Zn-dependent protease